MIGTLLSIIGIFISYFGVTHESTNNHLKKSPRIKAIIISVFVLSGLFSLFTDISDRHESTRTSKTIDSLSGASKELAIMVDTFRNENQRLHFGHTIALAKHDSNTIEILARYGLKVDSLTNTIQQFDKSVIKETPPTLSILAKPKIEFLYDKKERVFSYEITALNSDVHLLDYYYVILNINIQKDTITDSPILIPGFNFNFTSIIPSGQIRPLSFFLDRIEKRKDTFMVAIEFDYKSKGNKRQAPLRKVYYVNLGGKPEIIEVNNYIFWRVSMILKRWKIWSKFYDL